MSSAADPTATLFRNLQSSGLLTAAQMTDLLAFATKTQPDPKALAREVARRGWLTPFQIKEVARGQAAGLRVADRYVLLDILGEGGMGRVYKAHDSRMGRDVALKVIRKEKLSNPTALARFEQEIQALSRMTKHPNVVEVFVADQLGDSHYCVMEYIDGTDLTKLVGGHGPMPIPMACDAIRQAAAGLEHAHQTGLVHRDIKPSNILIQRNGGPAKLVDLGLARIADAPDTSEAHRITQEGFVIGTPDFLAPEQARDPMNVDIRADIYALGGTLFYILTGRVPFEGATATEKLVMHCTAPPPSLLDYRFDAPPQLGQLILWCMAKDPKDRPQTPIQLAGALLPFCPPQPPGTGAFVTGPASGRFAPQPVVAAAPPSGRYAPQPVAGPVAPPVYAPAGFPVPQADPVPSSQIFKLPPQTADDDPIRRRAEGGFPVTGLLLLLGALFVLGVLGFAVYRAFLRPDVAAPDTFTNSVNMKMVKLDGGTFKMGSPDNEPNRKADEGPVREVTIRGPIYFAETEVTNLHFRKSMGRSALPAAGKFAAQTDYLPVENVTWDEANEFCAKLTEKEKNEPWFRKGWVYRLPTEAEWEWACRAGTDTPFAAGDRLIAGGERPQAVYTVTGSDEYEEGDRNAKQPRFPADARKTVPNKFGLYDAHGNVAEWCADFYRAEAYKTATKENPTGPADGDKRVVRGGSFRDPATNLRSAARNGLRPDTRDGAVGFRAVYGPPLK
jgi:formylglycine-generating enzyme required for sulfatase activity/tRNA A-37 threonylcarbamoyl transferase component Bud32